MKKYDVLIIGGGIVGSAMAWELSHYYGNFAVVEAAPDVGTGTTKGTGGLIHAGYDPAPGTLKALLNVRGSQMYEALAQELRFPYKKTGSLVVGFNEEDHAYLQMLKERGTENQVPDLQMVYGEQIFRLEPAVNPKATCALYSPQTAITDPYETAIALAESAALNGVSFRFNSPVTAITRLPSGGFQVTAGTQTLQADYIVNAAGCHADDVAALVGDHSFTIRCKHGDLLILDKTYMPKVSMALYPVPSQESKGVAVVPTVSGNLSIGSTSVFREKEDIQTYADGVNTLIKESVKLVSGIEMGKIIRPFAGLRAVVEHNANDFYIQESECVPGLFHLAGIQSPGISSAPAIAQYVMGLLSNRQITFERKDPAQRIQRNLRPDTSAMSPEELHSLIQTNPDYGEVICRCEFVTKGEILDAIHSEPFGATTIDGVKRRTRAGMGRCQGGFCQHKVLELLAQELHVSPEEILKEKAGSEVVFGPVKGGNHD